MGGGRPELSRGKESMKHFILSLIRKTLLLQTHSYWRSVPNTECIPLKSSAQAPILSDSFFIGSPIAGCLHSRRPLFLIFIFLSDKVPE